MNFASDNQLLFAFKFFGGGVCASLFADAASLFLPLKEGVILSIFRSVLNFVAGVTAFIIVYFYSLTEYVMAFMPLFLILGMVCEQKTIGKTLAFIHLKVYNGLIKINSKFFAGIKRILSKIDFRGKYGQTKVEKNYSGERVDGNTVVVYSALGYDLSDVRHKKQRRSYKRTRRRNRTA